MARSCLTGAAFAVAALLTAPPFAQAAQTGLVGLPSAAQKVGFSVHFPLRNEAQLEQLVQMQGDRNSPLYHHYLSVAQFRANFGPAPQTVTRAAAGLRARGLTIVGQSTQSLRVSGMVATVEKSFGTRLGILRDAAGSARVASIAPLSIPAELSAVGAAVTGFEPRVHFHVDSRQVPTNRSGPFGGYWFDDLKQAYSYPSDGVADGTGANVGVLMASDVLDSDTYAAFAHENYTAISGKTPLEIKRVPIFGGGGTNGGAFSEASIDVQSSLGSAPGAQIYLYNIPDLTDESTIAGYTQIDEDNAVDVVSSSFGESELFYTPAYNGGVDYTGILRTYHQLFLQGNSQGITFTASSGDSAGLGGLTLSYFTGGPARFIPGVETPAADPNVTAVGGTNLQTTTPPSPQPNPPVLRSKYVGESALGDKENPSDPYGTGVDATGGYWGSGSGVSVIWPKPWYQKLVKTGSNRRTIPDISMQMGGCPGGAPPLAVHPCHPGDSFGIFYIGGTAYGFIGTSLSSPEFAGLLGVEVGLTHQRLGNANGYIYELAQANDALPMNFATRFYHQGIAGYNGVVTVAAGTRGYNPIIGVGTPYAENFLGIPQAPLAGDPQTQSNP